MMACRHTTVPEMFRPLATKIMIWALARVMFSTAKIISWSNNLFFHGLPSKLLQLFYFSPNPVFISLDRPLSYKWIVETSCTLVTYFVLKVNVFAVLVDRHKKVYRKVNIGRLESGPIQGTNPWIYFGNWRENSNCINVDLFLASLFCK
jgi:hypothetical protein